jgi:hypothetical protein
MSTAFPAYCEEGEVFFREDFEDLDGWEPLQFPKIKEHTEYAIELSGGESRLVAVSNSSASAIAYTKEFDVYEYPRVRWRWRISNVYEKGDAATKKGDDYPMRVYIMFTYDPSKASFGRRIKYGLAKTLYGEYPPDSSLNYIWANRKYEEKVLTNAYADQAKMILLQGGPEKSGEWQDEEVDILEDYRLAFGKDPPARARIAIMNDSDNTGESSVSEVDFIEVMGR